MKKETVQRYGIDLPKNESDSFIIHFTFTTFDILEWNNKIFELYALLNPDRIIRRDVCISNIPSRDGAVTCMNLYYEFFVSKEMFELYNSDLKVKNKIISG